MTDEQKQRMAEEYARRMVIGCFSSLKDPHYPTTEEMEAHAGVSTIRSLVATVEHQCETGFLAGLNARDEEIRILREAIKVLQMLANYRGPHWNGLELRNFVDLATEALQHTSKKEVSE